MAQAFEVLPFPAYAAMERKAGGAPHRRPRRSPTNPPRARQASAPDPELFVRDHASRWRLRLGVFTRVPAGLDVRPGSLRALLGAPAADGQTRGGIPDDLLSAAAIGGAITNMAFLDILDGGCFERAPCLCCYAARSASRAREAGASLRLFERYYDAQSYASSHAFARLVSTLSRDLLAEEVAEVREHVSRLDCTPDDIRALNGFQDLCVTAPPCQPSVLWVYSTPAGRRLLRYLSRELRQRQLVARVAVASSLAAALPRFRYRMYAITVSAPDGASVPGGGLGCLLEMALGWASRGEKNKA